MRLAADSNPLLSALIGGQAKAVLRHPSVEEVVTVASVLAEVAEYAPVLAERGRLDTREVMLAVAALPVRVVPEKDYRARRAEARRRIGGRDPDDVDLLALALALGIPVWSNDNDFEGAGVEWYTTAEVLKRLKTRKGPRPAGA